MKQKIVIKLPLHDDKCRSRALKAAADVVGIESVAVAGEEKDQLVVVGDGIDSVKLARRLKKKFGRAELLSVGAADGGQSSPPSPAAEPPMVGVVAPPYYGLPPYHHYEIREPTCFGPCTIL